MKLQSRLAAGAANCHLLATSSGQLPQVAVPCAVLCHVARLEEYAKRGAEPESELQIYTWPDATLRELTELIKDVRPDARSSRWVVTHSINCCDRGQ
jgi:hypothetical protein